MREAEYYKKYGNQQTRCTLCPHNCRIDEGARGKCKVRLNRGGTLYSEVYGSLSAIALDPVEKKPLYHFYPGRRILSVGSYGCNLICSHCQNYLISQSFSPGFEHHDRIKPEQLVRWAQTDDSCAGIAYTYNEPTVWYEYMYDTAFLAAGNSVPNVVVSNGFINAGPLEKLIDVVDAFNIDLKAYNDSFYRRVAGGTLAPVKRALKTIRKRKKHLEITFLLISGMNDDEAEFRSMLDWIAGELGEKTVLHISRYHPAWRMDLPPTDAGEIEKFHHIAREKLSWVYAGNIPGSSKMNNTECPRCFRTVIRRSGYKTSITGLDPRGKCPGCGEPVAVMS